MTKRADLVRELELAGFRRSKAGQTQSHDKFRKDGYKPIAVPRHREINEITAEAIRRQAGLR